MSKRVPYKYVWFAAGVNFTLAVGCGLFLYGQVKGSYGLMTTSLMIILFSLTLNAMLIYFVNKY